MVMNTTSARNHENNITQEYNSRWQSSPITWPSWPDELSKPGSLLTTRRQTIQWCWRCPAVTPAVTPAASQLIASGLLQWLLHNGHSITFTKAIPLPSEHLRQSILQQDYNNEQLGTHKAQQTSILLKAPRKIQTHLIHTPHPNRVLRGWPTYEMPTRQAYEVGLRGTIRGTTYAIRGMLRTQQPKGHVTQWIRSSNPRYVIFFIVL